MDPVHRGGPWTWVHVLYTSVHELLVEHYTCTYSFFSLVSSRTTDKPYSMATFLPKCICSVLLYNTNYPLAAIFYPLPVPFALLDSTKLVVLEC